MQIAVTGATGFLGRYIVNRLASAGHACRCWFRPHGDRGGFDGAGGSIDWLPGELGDITAGEALVEGCDAVVHSALYRTAETFRGSEPDLSEFVIKNVLGTIHLIEAARAAGVGRFVFISTCAVHEEILDDRPLDEAHPLWPKTHYGAHKAAIEKFVHSYGLGQGYPICALRPTGIYGAARPIETSKWFPLVQSIVHGEDVECSRGGKEVHADDVARAVEVLLRAEEIAGEAYSCYDQYVSQYDVATIAKQLSGSNSTIHGSQTQPKHEIVTDKIKRLGMEFGGRDLLERTVGELVEAVK